MCRHTQDGTELLGASFHRLWTKFVLLSLQIKKNKSYQDAVCMNILKIHLKHWEKKSVMLQIDLIVL